MYKHMILFSAAVIFVLTLVACQTKKQTVRSAVPAPVTSTEPETTPAEEQWRAQSDESAPEEDYPVATVPDEETVPMDDEDFSPTYDDETPEEPSDSDYEGSHSDYDEEPLG
jgi:hypothetical protein